MYVEIKYPLLNDGCIQENIARKILENIGKDWKIFVTE